MRAVALLVALGTAALGAAPAPAPPSARVLVFTKTAAFRHDSIPAAVATLRELGARHGLVVDVTEDGGTFADATLARYDAVAFVLTTGDVLDAPQQAALQRYVERGGGFVGVHSAADTEYDWPWYGRLVGARFAGHGPVEAATVTVEAPRELSTARLPRAWSRRDEWYAFRTDPRGSVRVLASLDGRAVAWSHLVGRGRAWYTAGGHTAEAYGEPLFRAHLLGGLLHAAGFDPPRIQSVVTRVTRTGVAVRVRFSRVHRPIVTARAGTTETRLRVRGQTATGTVRGRRVVVTLVDATSALRVTR